MIVWNNHYLSSLIFLTLAILSFLAAASASFCAAISASTLSCRLSQSFCMPCRSHCIPSLMFLSIFLPIPCTAEHDCCGRDVDTEMRKINTLQKQKAKKKKRMLCCPQVEFLKKLHQSIWKLFLLLFLFFKAPKAPTSTSISGIFHSFSQKTPKLNKIGYFPVRTFYLFIYLFFFFNFNFDKGWLLRQTQLFSVFFF